MKNKLIAILGFSGSGKNHISRILEKQYNLKNVVSVTTRPIRGNSEVDGRDYHFISDEQMQQYINNNELIEYREYHTIKDGKKDIWKYGICQDEIDLRNDNHIVVVDLDGLKALEEYFDKKNIISIFLDVDYETRKKRASKRAGYESAEFSRRYNDDRTKFKDVIDSVDYLVENYDLDECIKEIDEILNK